MFKFGRQTGAKQVNNGLTLQPVSEMSGEIKCRGGRLVQRVAKHSSTPVWKSTAGPAAPYSAIKAA
jgi:hypothetical protein